ncbi:MAG: hypothetical protein O7D27_07750 [Alphaproteobacteria bacterium]|nr:hypothetical protein [Alphaproteobacteria bacterium]
MKQLAPLSRRIFALGFVTVTLSPLSSAWAQRSRSELQDLVDDIVRDVIDRTVEAARRAVLRNTGIDPLERGYHSGRRYSRAPSNASSETRRELRKLNQEHDRKIAKLEQELQRTLRKARAEFRREAAKEDKRGKIRKKRKKLQEKVNKAYDRFEEKIAKENSRFDEKRDNILRKR